jgi:hypothetical protein
MTRTWTIGAFAAAFAFSAAAAAAEEDRKPAKTKKEAKVELSTDAVEGERGYNPFAVGAYLSMGVAHVILNSSGDYGIGDPKPRFAGGGGAYFDYYLSKLLALDVGVDFIGKGFRSDYLAIANNSTPTKDRVRVIYLEIPLGAKLNLQGFRAGVSLVLSFAISGKTKRDDADGINDHTWGDHDWDNYRRFNLLPRVTLGYAIPVGPIFIVPGLAWSMEIINSAKGVAADDLDAKYRNWNLMITAGIEYSFDEYID